jgi:hypothetical protein
MTFEHALRQGDLDVARAILHELAELPDTGGLRMPECYVRSLSSPVRRFVFEFSERRPPSYRLAC